MSLVYIYIYIYFFDFFQSRRIHGIAAAGMGSSSSVEKLSPLVGSPTSSKSPRSKKGKRKEKKGSKFKHDRSAAEEQDSSGSDSDYATTRCGSMLRTQQYTPATFRRTVTRARLKESLSISTTTNTTIATTSSCTTRTTTATTVSGTSTATTETTSSAATREKGRQMSRSSSMSMRYYASFFDSGAVNQGTPGCRESSNRSPQAFSKSRHCSFMGPTYSCYATPLENSGRAPSNMSTISDMYGRFEYRHNQSMKLIAPESDEEGGGSCSDEEAEQDVTADEDTRGSVALTPFPPGRERMVNHSAAAQPPPPHSRRSTNTDPNAQSYQVTYSVDTAIAGLPRPQDYRRRGAATPPENVWNPRISAPWPQPDIYRGRRSGVQRSAPVNLAYHLDFYESSIPRINSPRWDFIAEKVDKRGVPILPFINRLVGRY